MQGSSDSNHNRGIQLRSLASHLIETLRSRVFRSRAQVCSELELEVAPFFCNIQKISVDVGADQGSYSFGICSHTADCVAFEPRLPQVEKIRETANANGLRIRVEAI